MGTRSARVRYREPPARRRPRENTRTSGNILVSYAAGIAVLALSESTVRDLFVQLGALLGHSRKSTHRFMSQHRSKRVQNVSSLRRPRRTASGWACPFSEQLFILKTVRLVPLQTTGSFCQIAKTCAQVNQRTNTGTMRLVSRAFNAIAMPAYAPATGFT